MDSSSTPQTVAQAVQAAAAAQQQAQQQQAQQQTQQQQTQASPAVQSQHIHAATVDNLTCQWQGCGERCDNPEALYDHVCERHVGRKSTNNLNLTCQWGACRTTTVKRDHITSHIRVHVPLKPHKCEFCGKAFKRPQDLKKHVKTHADDSVLMNSPQHADSNRVANNAASYYSTAHEMSGNPYGNYQPAMQSAAITAGGYSQPPHSQYAGYGSVSYPNNTAMADIQSMDTRRRAIEALNDFLGDVKRRAIDPTTYYDVGNRLQTNALPLPIGGTGYNTGYNNSNYNGLNAATLLENFNNGTHLQQQTAHVGGVASQNYSLPVSNARTKNDLQDIDRFLEQLQATVYETSNAAAAAGIQQPGLHSQAFGDFVMGGHNSQYRSSHSPPAFQNHLGHNMNNNGGNVSGLSAASSASLDTPALTPASVTSYASSSHSPMSSHSRASFGSSSGANMYPSLPSLTGMSDLGSNYPVTTSAPASGLVANFDGLDGRRYSGGRLQRQAPASADVDTDMPDVEDGSRTPRASDEKLPSSKDGNTGLVDPALRSEDTPASPANAEAAGTATPTSAADERRQEQWVENIRVIEALRKWIGDRLKAQDYEDAAAAVAATANAESSDEAKPDVATLDRSAVETAKMATAEMAEEKMAAALKAEIDYPSLPTA